MSVINLSFKHGQTLDQAREHLRSAVKEAHATFAAVMKEVVWAPDGDAVRMTGRGFTIDLRLDAEHLHASGDITALGGLLSSPLAAGIKLILSRHFPKRLT